MRNFIIFSTLGILFSLGSCQKIIDVDLNDAAKKIVLEANFNASDSIVHVKVSYTSSFFDTYVPSIVNDAIVTITDHLGNTTSIPSIGNGKYQINGYAPTPGATYLINVSHDGTTYTGSSTLMNKLELLDPTATLYNQGFFGEPGGYLVSFRFQDPPGLGNYYKIIVQANDSVYDKPDEVILGDDFLTDGNLLERPIFTNYYTVGDTITFEIQAITDRVYDYYTELQTIAGSQSSSAPANPTSLWTNTALGYFSAYYNSKKGIRITE
jgi:hypothetical protein